MSRLAHSMFLLCLSALTAEAAKGVHEKGVRARILDATGSPSNAGLLQVDAGSGVFGSVCGLNLAAADVICRSLGFDFGSVSPSSCSNYGGKSMCGAAGSLVAMQGLACIGDELSVDACTWSTPTGGCLGHDSDAIVFCGLASGPAWDGTARLLSPDGAPSLSDEGLLEVFVDGSWESVCGLSEGAASVACKSMGFSGSSGRPSTALSAWPTAPPPGLGDVRCAGGERGLLECSFQRGDDVMCAPQEAQVLRCSGAGNSLGRPPAATV